MMPFLLLGEAELAGPVFEHGPADGEAEGRGHQGNKTTEEQPPRLGLVRHVLLAIVVRRAEADGAGARAGAGARSIDSLLFAPARSAARLAAPTEKSTSAVRFFSFKLDEVLAKLTWGVPLSNAS